MVRQEYCYYCDGCSKRVDKDAIAILGSGATGSIRFRRPGETRFELSETTDKGVLCYDCVAKILGFPDFRTANSLAELEADRREADRRSMEGYR